MMNADSPDVSDGYAKEGRGVSPKLDAALDLLSNRRRRYALYYLREQGDAVSLDELAEQITSWDSETDDEDPARVRTDLYHSQIPRMESAGIVTFDAEANAVELDEGDSPISEYLDLAAREEDLI